MKRPDMKTGKKKRVVKFLEDPECAGHYRVEIWTGGEIDLIFPFANKEEALRRYDIERSF